MYADTQHPLANLGSDYDRFTEADSSQKLDLIFQSLERFDYWLKPRLNTAIGDALAKESLRMQTFAQKEANSGNYASTDALNLFDFSGCLSKLPGDRCVLLRYAGEGIAQYARGSEAGDVYEMNNGYLRMRAALLALGDFSISSNSKAGYTAKRASQLSSGDVPSAAIFPGSDRPGRSHHAEHLRSHHPG